MEGHRGHHSRFWEGFVLRDLSYIAGGVVVILSGMRTLGFRVSGTVYNACSGIGTFLVFILAAYFVGMIAQKALAYMGILRTSLESRDHKEWASNLMLVAQVGERQGSWLRFKYEQCSLRAIAASTLGNASLIGSLLWLIALITSLVAYGSLSSNGVVYIVLAVLLFVTFLIALREFSGSMNKRAALLEEFRKLSS